MMRFAPLPSTSALADYEAQATALLAAWREGESTALEFLHAHVPRLRDAKVAWLPQQLSVGELRALRFDEADARNATARAYDFADWEALAAFVLVTPDNSFERAVDAVVEGDLETLRTLLTQEPELVRARSRRVTQFEPPVHRATLLHYVAANGTENYRQKSPSNAVAIAAALLDAGAEVDALANLYGSEWTTLNLLVSSSPPAQASVQLPLIELLVARGASLSDTAVETALVFGFREAALALVKQGARLTLASAAALGDIAALRESLAKADSLERHRAMALAAQAGEEPALRVLLDAGEDPNRFNPLGMHSHATPLHQAALAGHLAVVRLLLERGARADVRDTIYQSTPLGWAEHGGQAEAAALLAG